MKKYRRIVSAALLLCMIASLIPMTPRVSAAETEGVHYELATSIQPGETYIVMRATKPWGSTEMKYYTVDGAGNPGDYSEAVTPGSDGKIAYFEGIERYEWKVEAYGTGDEISMLHQHTSNGTLTNRYLSVSSSGVAFQSTPSALRIGNGTQAQATNGEYIIYVPYETNFYYLAWSTSPSNAFRAVSNTSLNYPYGLRFYKKVNPQPTTHTISFDGNGNTAGAAPLAGETSNGSYTIPALPDGFAKEGCYFGYWTEAKDGSGTQYAPGQEITVTKDLVLYAQWLPNPKYQVTVTTTLDNLYQDLPNILGKELSLYLCMNGGDGTLLPLTKKEAGVYTAEVEKNGTYSVYILNQDATYEDTGKQVTIASGNGSVALVYYSVTYNANNGTLNGADTSYVVAAGQKVTALTQVPTRAGFKFTGWITQEGKILAPGDVITDSLQGIVKLTAMWEEVVAEKTTYIIRYLEKGTYHILRADVTVEGAAVGSLVIAAQQAQNLQGYTYVGATIGGVYYEKERDPQMTLSNKAAENVIIIHYIPDPDMHLHKEATLENNGTYTIQMEMFTHNNPVTTLVDENLPLDIVLVLDQSSSMNTGGVLDDLEQSVKTFIDLVADHGRTNQVDHRLAVVGYGSANEYGASGNGPIAGSYDKTNGKTEYEDDLYWTNTGVFGAHGDFHAYPITGFNYEEFTGEVKTDGTYYTYSHGEYLLLTYHTVYRHMITESEAYHQWLDGVQIYGYVDGKFEELTRNTSGMWIYNERYLYSEEEFFTRHEDVWTHRHGTEAREIHAYMVNGEYQPVDGHDTLFTRQETTEANPDKSIYRDALIAVTMGQKGSGYVDPSLAKIADNLGARGKTYISYGMEMANSIFAANPLSAEDKAAGRQRIIVVFTDGKPGDSTNFDEIESNKAIAQSYISTNTYDAQVFTVGLYGSEIVGTESDQDYFMNGLSSNYSNAQSLGDVWNSTVFKPALTDVYLNLGGPYYAKVGDNYYPLENIFAQAQDPNNPEEKKYYSFWRYNNGSETVVISQIENIPTKAQEHPVIRVFEENGVQKIGVNGVEIYRKAGNGYKPADSDKYYFQTQNAAELEEYFATIVRDLTTRMSSEVLLENDTILRDIMGQGLVLTENSVISVYQQAGVFDPDAKHVTWAKDMVLLDQLLIPENPTDTLASEKGIYVDGEFLPYISVYNLQSANPTDPQGANYAPHTVDVVGYDYSSWYMNAGKLSGFRLVATITGVEAQDDVTWGRAQSTNHNKSGLYLPKDSNGDRQLLEAFVQPSTVFVERAYVLDYGKEFALSGWYFDPEDGKPAEALHLDCQIENGMNQFDEKLPTVVNGSTTGNTQYGNVRIENGRVYYQPTTMQWGGYDQFYVFGNTWRNTVLSQSANENGNLWNKVTVIPASNIYYEDTFETENESGGANAFSGFVFSEGWGTAYTDDKPANAGKNEEHPEHVEDSSYGGVHGWTDSLADDVYFSDGSAHVAGLNETMGAKATFTFTGTGVDIYTRTNQKSGIVVAKLSGQTQDGTSVSKSIFMDNLAMSGDYYQIPTLSFVNLDYGTYQVTLIATAASAVATGEKRYEYYVDGVRVYDPLGKVTQASDTVVKDAYGKEINGVYTEIRDIMIANNDFTAGLPHTGAIGAVFIDWIRDGQGTGSDVPGVKTGTYEVSTTFKTYGPKNEVYLAEGQAVVIKVDAQNTYYVGMKSITLGLAAKVNVSGLAMKDPQTITVGHSTDMYYEVTPIVDEETGDAYIVIQNASENDALLALTKLRTTNPHGDSAVNGVQLVAAAEAVSAMELYSEALEEAKTRPEEEAPETEKPVDPLAINQQQTSQLFANVRTWLEEEKEDVA